MAMSAFTDSYFVMLKCISSCHILNQQRFQVTEAGRAQNQGGSGGTEEANPSIAVSLKQEV